jgi:hypothetical protein
MEGVGRAVPSIADGLDFLDNDLLRGGEQSVDATLDAQDEFAAIQVAADANLFFISLRSGALNPLMAANACQGAVGTDKIALPAQVPPAQGKLDELAHLDGKNWLGQL